MNQWRLIIVIFLFVFSLSRAESAETRKVYAYIANTGSNTISRVDTADNTIKQTITVGSGPIGVAVTPDGKKIYVTNRLSLDRMSAGNTVSVINTDKLMESPVTITVGSIPDQIVISPDGKNAYVTNSGSNTVSVIDTTNDTAIPSTITVGESPKAIAISPNGKKIYVANDGPDNISVIRTADNKLIETIQFTPGHSPEGIAITPDGKKAYVTNANVVVSVIDIAEGSPTENKIIKTISLLPKGVPGVWSVAVSPNGKKVYVTNPASPGTTVTVISTETDEFVTTIQVGTNPEGVAFTPDGQFVYVTNSTSSTVSVIDFATSQVIKTIDGFNASQTFGNFITPLPIVKFSTSEVTFPSQAPNPSTGTQTITLTNSGNGILEISNIAISGNFSQTNNCGSSLTAYANCTITVTLLVADGTVQTGSLTVATNASDTPTTIPVRGSLAPAGGGAGGCSLTQPNSNNFKFSALLFLMSVGYLFSRRKKVKN